MIRISSLLGGLAALALGASASAQSLEDFAALPGVFDPQISEDGRYAAIACRGEANSRVCVYDLANGGAAQVFGLPPYMRGYRHEFVGPNHILLSGEYTEELPSSEGGVDDFWFVRAISFNLETGEAVPFNNNVDGAFDNRFVVSRNTQDPETVLVEFARRVGGDTAAGTNIRSTERVASALYRVNLDTGRGRRISMDIVNRRIIRPDGTISGEIIIEPETGDVEIRRVEGDRATLYEANHPIHPPRFLGFDGQGDYVLRFEVGELRGVQRLDIETGALSPLMPELEGLLVFPIIDRHSNVVVGLQATLDDRPIQYWLDEGLESDASALAGALGVERVYLNSWSADRDVMAFEIAEAGRPSEYYLYERSAGSVSPFGSENPALSSVEIGTVFMTEYQASDGLTIPAVVTLPQGQTVEDGPFPLIVMPHGGPAERDSLLYDWWRQAYASQGYAVVQPNFRGSSGYGREFQAAGFGEFGGRMIDDIVEAARAMREAGIAQDGPVCFVGWSYGGYAALMAGIRAPQEAACVVAVAPVTDPIFMLGRASRARANSNLAFWEQYIGDRFMGGEAAESISPWRRAGELVAPTLVIHGENDEIVPIEQSEALASSSAGRESFTFIKIEGEGHNLLTAEARLLLLQRSLELLDETLR